MSNKDVWQKPQLFTLLELMVGMTVLSILMLMLLQFLVSSQQTLNWSDRMWRIYENSRTVFDLIERDLQASVTSTEPGSEIKFFLGEPDITKTNDAIHICFVASTDPPNDNATSRLCEITYRYHEAYSTDSSNRSNTLYRRIISNADNGADWDFFTSDTWYKNDDAATTSSRYQKVVGGIQNFSIKFYDNDTTPLNIPTGGIIRTEKPTSVGITFELFDESLINASDTEQAKSLRGFFKDIDLRKF